MNSPGTNRVLRVYPLGSVNSRTNSKVVDRPTDVHHHPSSRKKLEVDEEDISLQTKTPQKVRDTQNTG